MKRLFAFMKKPLAIIALLVIPAVAYAAYVAPSPGKDGWFVNTVSGNLVLLRQNVFTGFQVSSGGVTTIDGTASSDALIVDEGTARFDEGISSPAVATAYQVIRFCGNGPDGATTTYIGPVLASDIIDVTGGAQDPVDVTFGSSFCDGLDSTTESTADRVFHAGWAYKPVSMACVGLCTGATAANDAIVFQLRDDTASVAGMTCTTAVLGGDATPAQCVVRDSTPSTIAAGSALAVSVTMTNDDCNDAGDDFECYVIAAIQ